MSSSDLGGVLAIAEGIATEHLRPRVAQVDRDAAWPEQSLRALLEAGLGGLVVPVADGGHGHGLHGLLRVCEILGAACPSTSLCFGMHCVAAAVIATRPTEPQRRQLLEPIVAGKHLTTLSLSEPGSGSHFWLPATTMTREGNGLRIRGTKSMVTNGGHADSYVVSTASPEGDPGTFSCVVVPGTTPGLTWGAPWRGVGMRGNAARTAEIDAEIPADMLLGAEGDQLFYVFQVVAPFFLAAMTGTYLGAATEALALTREHLTTRRHAHSAATLAENAVVQHRVGTLWAMLERTRRLTYFAAIEGDSGGPDALPALCSAKAEVADTAVALANEAMTLSGGTGYREGARVEQILRDVRAAHVMAPTTDTLRQWTGRLVLGQPLLE